MSTERERQAAELIEAWEAAVKQARTYGVDHPACAASLADVTGRFQAVAPLEIQFVGGAVFAGRKLLPVTDARFEAAAFLATAFGAHGVQELHVRRAPTVGEVAALLRTLVGPPAHAESFESGAFAARALEGVRWGATAEQVSPEAAASVDVALAFEEIQEVCPPLGASTGEGAPWSWSTGLGVLRRLERARTTHRHAATHLLETAPVPWSPGRGAVAIAYRALGVLADADVRPVYRRAIAHAGLAIGVELLAADRGNGEKALQAAAERAFVRLEAGLPAAQRGDAHPVRVLSCVHRFAGGSGTGTGSSSVEEPLQLLALLFRLEQGRVPPGFPRALSFGDLLAQAAAGAREGDDALAFRLLVSAEGVFPVGTPVVLHDGRVGIVVAPGPFGAPGRPHVLVGEPPVRVLPEADVRLLPLAQRRKPATETAAR